MIDARHASALLPFAAAAALAAGCASGGSGEKISPTVAAPTLNQPVNRNTATIPSTSAGAPSPGTASTTESRHMLPDEVKGKAPLDPRWEYRLYNYLSVNERGQHELSLLLQQLTPQGWELHQVQVAPRGHNKAIFRRPKVRGVPVTPVPRPPDVAAPPPGAGRPPSATPAVDGAGAPSSLFTPGR